MSQKGNYEIVGNALPSVDTFFLIGATLVSYLSFQQLEKGRFNIVLFYVHRYIRYTKQQAIFDNKYTLLLKLKEKVMFIISSNI